MTAISEDLAYIRLKDQLITKTGLAFYANRDGFITSLIEARLQHLQLQDCSSYLKFLDRSGQANGEMELLIAQLTIGETYFFRDEGQFAALREVILPDILQRKQASKELRIWSAACATGAEPYSLAILLEREFAGLIEGWQITIHATDLNRSYLDRAANGKFRAWALRSVTDEIKRDCFSNKDRIWTIHPRYKRWISFHQMNLVEKTFPALLPEGAHYDLILCRNVMIYFTPAANRHLVARLHGSLEDGGWLLVGSAEYNLENYTAFRTVSVPGAKLYQKAARDVAPPQIADRAAAPAPGPAPASSQPPDLSGLRELADRGDWQAAADYGQRLLSGDLLNPALHFYRALILENLGDLGESERSLRHAIYLDRNFAMAHYHLGLALQRDRKMRGAARSFGNTLTVLAGVAGDAMVAGGSGITVRALRVLATTHLEHAAGKDSRP